MARPGLSPIRAIGILGRRVACNSRSVSELTLAPLTHAQYPRFLELVSETYASGATNSGEMTAQQARARAAQELTALLPDGPETASMLVRTVNVTGRQVGHVWVGIRGPAEAKYGWIWDVYVDPAHRGRHYGAQAIHLAETEARARFGISEVRLNVFANNYNAIRLYERLGYAVTSQIMRRSIDSPSVPLPPGVTSSAS
jgi:ribosomal protein S18 acetylase RimI-like enzyme